MEETVIGDDGKEYPVKRVEAVMVSANQASMGSTITRDQAKRIEQAMVMAVTWCNQNGIVDPAKVKEKILQAREMIKRKFAEEAAEAEKARIAAEAEAEKKRVAAAQAGNPAR